MTNPTPPQSNRPKMGSLHRESGASLVEILVVMVVLLVGIFTIVRIFPTGFDVLQMTSNKTVAHRLAQAEIEFWRKNAENLPEGIVPIQPGPPGYSQFDPTARPNDFTSGTGAYGDYTVMRENVRSKLGNNATEAEIDRWVGQNRQRRILGEITRIPAPSPVQGGSERFASIYTLAYAPIDWVKGGNPSDQNIADQYLQIRGNALATVDITGLTGDQLRDRLENLDKREVAINYREAIAYFPKSDRPRYFLASYTYRTKDGGVKTVRTDPLAVRPTQTNPRGAQEPASAVTLGVMLQGSAVDDRGSFNGIEPGTVDISPKFRYLPNNQPFSNDRNDPYSVYEYKVLSKYSLGVEFTAGIAFNPRGYRERETVQGLSTPLQARIDYIVKDWRILHQDVSLPTGNAPYRSRVALPFLKMAGVTTENDSLEPWPGLGTPQQQISLIAIDTENGNMSVNCKADGEAGCVGVDSRTGSLSFPRDLNVYRPSSDQARVDPAGRNFRIFYSVEGDWAVVPQKAFLNYDVISFAAARGANNFTLPIGNTTVVPRVQCVDFDPNDGRSCGSDARDYDAVQVLFPAVDEGKAVTYDFSYRSKNNQLKTVQGQEQQITAESRMTGGKSWTYSDPGQTNAQETPKPYIWVRLPGDASVSNFTNDFVLRQVRGVSFRAVTVWRDRSRWRQEAITTHLTRAAS